MAVSMRAAFQVSSKGLAVPLCFHLMILGLCTQLDHSSGGIDYAMLVAVKKGWMLPITEKRINCKIQVGEVEVATVANQFCSSGVERRGALSMPSLW